MLAWSPELYYVWGSTFEIRASACVNNVEVKGELLSNKSVEIRHSESSRDVA
jgi:hypothetical protein